MIYDYSKLRGRIVEKFGNLKNFSKEMDMDSTLLSNRLNNKTPWTQDEMTKAIDKLSIPDNEIRIYFFYKKVQIN